MDKKRKKDRVLMRRLKEKKKKKRSKAEQNINPTYPALICKNLAC